MNSSAHAKIIALVVLALWCLGCKHACAKTLRIDLEKHAEIEELVASELEPGDSAEAIEAFFERHDITYSFDRFSNRYQAIIRDASPKALIGHDIGIFVELDEQRRFVEAEVASMHDF